MVEAQLTSEEALAEIANISGSTAKLAELFSQKTDSQERVVLVIERAHDFCPRKLQVSGMTADRLAVLILAEQNFVIPNGRYSHTNADRGVHLLYIPPGPEETIEDLFKSVSRYRYHGGGEGNYIGEIKAVPDQYFGGGLSFDVRPGGVYLGKKTAIFLEMAAELGRLSN